MTGYATVLEEVQRWKDPNSDATVVVGDIWRARKGPREVKILAIYVGGDFASVRMLTIRGGKPSNTSGHARNLIKRFTLVSVAEPKIAPCPFCGHAGGRVDRTLRDGYAKYQDDPDAFAYFVICPSCAATGGWAKSKSGAVRSWNMRTVAA